MAVAAVTVAGDKKPLLIRLLGINDRRRMKVAVRHVLLLHLLRRLLHLRLRCLYRPSLLEKQHQLPSKLC